VIIEGYLDGWEPPFATSPLVDARALPTRPGFWPAFLHTVGGSESAVPAFDDDPANVSALIDEFLNPDAWPVLSVALHRGHQLHIVMRNFPGEGGVDYVVAPAGGGPHIPLASMEGHFRGPAASWPELVATASHPDELFSPAARLLLLQPVTADTDTPVTAPSVIAAALTSVGSARHQDAVAAETTRQRPVLVAGQVDDSGRRADLR
jgi:hypothetical protein